MPRRRGPRGQAIQAARRAEEQWRRTVNQVLRSERGIAQAEFRRQIALRGCPGQDAHLRRRLWLLLLGLETQQEPTEPESELELPDPDGMEDANLRDQLQLDVSRSLHNFEACVPRMLSGVPRTQAAARAALLQLMAGVLSQPGVDLHYYQGFHGESLSSDLNVHRTLMILMSADWTALHCRQMSHPCSYSTQE